MSQSADAYFIGRIEGCTGFKHGTFCRYWIMNGTQWRLVSGNQVGQTQTDSPSEDLDVCVWSHPIDAYFEFTSLAGWPKISFQVWEHDDLGRSYLGGYGFCNLPIAPGHHKIDVPVWRPVGTKTEEITSEYIGGSPILRDQSLAHNPTDRYKLKAESTGTIHVDMNVILGRTSNFPINFG